MGYSSVDNYVGPYRILRLINRGGQGSVYLGYDKRLHRKVAIKIYTMPSQRVARKRLLREAQLVAGIDSVKVVRIHDVIESRAHLALVMEYVPGCDLEEFLGAVRPSLASVLTIGADIAGALAVAGQRHIVHGDLKPGNILITESGRAKLSDFGISRNKGETPSRQWAAGSLSALSPEQFLGQPLDERTDLFSLGILLYRMLAGEHPFFREGVLEPHLLLSGSPRPLEELAPPEMALPTPLADLVSELLHKDPQCRPVNTRRVRQVLRAVSRDIPLAASNSLSHEARPCFRLESAEDIPPLVPADLGRAGRSRLAPGNSISARLRYRLAGFSRFAQCAMVVGVVAVAGVPLVTALTGGQTPVRFAEPTFTLSTSAYLPAEVSRRWLLHEVKSTLAEQLGPLRVIGEVGAPTPTTLNSPSVKREKLPEPEEEFQIALRCTVDLCVFELSRVHDEARYNRQGLLFPDSSLAQWRDVVRSTTQALYR
jgi:serine/threonine protein kinase